MTNSLTPDQQVFYQDNGYLVDLPAIYTPAEMAEHNRNLKELMALLRPDEAAKDIREWHEASRWLYDICMDPRILDLVEGILGPDFYMWASNFFLKSRTLTTRSAGTRTPTTGRWRRTTP